jgi:drug/metabolite transporter (DMT)-like permease
MVMLKGISAGLAAGALWGLVFVAPRMTPGLSPVDLAAGRFVSFGGLSALLMLWQWRTLRLPSPNQALFAVLMSVLGYTGYYLLLVLSIKDLGTELPALIIGTIPLWVMLLGRPAGLSWKAWLPGLALTAAGLLLMAQANFYLPGVDLHPNFWRGIFYAAAAMVLWTAFALLNSSWLKSHPDLRASDWANWLGMATGSGALAMWLLLGSDSKVLLALDGIAETAIICIATGLGSAWLATLLWNVASQRLSASLCGQLIVSETIFALLYSFAWDGLWPTSAQLAACLLFVFGILISIKAHR